MKKKKLLVEKYDYPLNKLNNANYKIRENNGALTPVCFFPISQSEQQSEKLLERQRYYANLFAASPELLEAMQKTADIMGKIDDTNIREYYGELAIQYAENRKLLTKILGKETKP